MKNKVKWILAILLILMIATIIICIIKNNKNVENGNIANMGLAIECDGVVYYNKYEKGIFAVKDSAETQLTDETAYSLNIFDNKLYYITVSDFNNVVIKSVDINGENLKTIATIYTSISKIFVEDGYIYYSTNKSGNGLVRIDVNGENETIMVSETIQDFHVSDNNVFYINSTNQICKISTDGKNTAILNENGLAKKIQVVDGWIYYYDENENGLFRVSENGKKNELVSVLVNNEVYNVSGKYVYYLDKENSKLARMQIGKSNQCDDIASINISKTKINIAGNELYYLDKSSNESQTYQMYRVKLNGEATNAIEY